MEKWLTVNQYMNTWVNMIAAVGSIGSAAVAYFALRYAKEQIKNFKVNSRIERNSGLAQDIVKNLFKLEKLVEKCLQQPSPQNIQNKIDSESFKNIPAPFQIIISNLELRFQLIVDNSIEIDDVIEEIRSKAEFIKNEKGQDPEVKKLGRILQTDFVLITVKMSENYREIVDTIKDVKEDSSSNNVDPMGTLYQLSSKYLVSYPHNYYDNRFQELNNFRNTWQSLKTYLIDNHVP